MRSVSIIMCTYNGEKYLAEQLDSILRQTYPIKEILVQDDGSTDRTIEILKLYSHDNPGIFRISTNSKQGNINHNFFSCANKADSEFIAFSDQDDIWDDRKIELLMNNIGNNNVCFHVPYHFRGQAPDFESLHDAQTIPNYGLPRQLIIGSVCGHTMLVRKSFLDYIMNNVQQETLDELPMYYDTIIADVSLIDSSIICIPNYLTLHRCHTLSVTSSQEKTYFKRGLSNFLIQLIKASNQKLRKRLKPKFLHRFLATKNLLLHFPKTENSIKTIKIIDSYLSRFRFVTFPIQLVKNRNEIMYKKEKNCIISIIRAILFPITMYNYHS